MEGQDAPVYDSHRIPTAAVTAPSCRLPRAAADDALGEPVRDGLDAVRAVASVRRATTCSALRYGGYLDAGHQLAAPPFGAPSCQAFALAPHHRLMLELLRAALDDVGTPPRGLWETPPALIETPSTLIETPTALVGGATRDECATVLRRGGFPVPAQRPTTGSYHSAIAPCVTCALGLRGPSPTVDVAPPVSLVAVHLACEGLRRGEPVLAIADTLHCLVRGTAVHHGGGGGRLTAPHAAARASLLRRAYTRAWIDVHHLPYGELPASCPHGGDPTVVAALGAVIGAVHGAADPLCGGSVKTNIGHVGSDAELAGLLPAALSPRPRQLPPTLPVDQPSPDLGRSTGRLERHPAPTPWPDTDRPRRTAVSSFDTRGTQAHPSVERAAPGDGPPAREEVPPTAGLGALVPWVVSAPTGAALRAQAGRLAEWALEQPALCVADVAWSLVTGRAALEHRAVVWGQDAAELAHGLRALADGEVAAPVSGVARHLPDPVWVFPGQGSQWAGMAAGLLGSCPVFATAVRECAAVMDPLVEWSLLDVLRDPETSALARVDVVQPALFAVMVGLARWWGSCGVRPGAVIGHSQGEIAAAHVAGALTLEDAVRIVVLRSRLLRDLPAGGGMVSVGVPAEEARTGIEAAGASGAVSIAAENGPTSVVLSGEVAALRALVAEYERAGVRVRWVPVAYASHSPRVAPVRGELERLLATVSPRPAEVPLYSTVTGRELPHTTDLRAGYWYAGLRQTVRLREAVSAAVADGRTVFIECSPHPGLLVPINQTLGELGTTGVVLGTLRRARGGPDQLAQALARAYVRGLPVDWPGLLAPGDPGAGRPHRVDLPTYASPDERFRLDPETGTAPPGPVDEDAGAIAPDRAPTDFRARQRLSATVRSWCYEVTWQPRPDAPLTSRLPGRWLVVRPTGEAGAARLAGAAEALRHRGADVAVLEVDAATVTRERLVALLGEQGADVAGVPLAGVLSLLADGATDDQAGLVRVVSATIALVQALGEAQVAAPLWCLTQGAVSAPGEELTSATGAALWGLGRVIGLEYPRRWGGLIDLPAAPGTRTWTTVAGVLATGSTEDQLAVRPLGLFVRRLSRIADAAPDRVPSRPVPSRPVPPGPASGGPASAGLMSVGPAVADPASVGPAVVGRTPPHPVPPGPAADGPAAADPLLSRPAWQSPHTVLITGGTGALGGHVARWCAANGTRRVVLVGRRGPQAPGAARLREELTAAGAEVLTLACDLTAPEAVPALLAEVRARGWRPRAVVHAAGVAGTVPLARTGPAEVAATLGAKTAGAAALDELLREADLEAFVLFSSAAGVWGGAGQGAYAAANAYLDALAQHRRDQGAPATSIAWGRWAGEGMATGAAAVHLNRAGLLAMAPEAALEALRLALVEGRTCVTVADVDWRRFAARYTAARPRPLIAGLTPPGEEPAPAATPADRSGDPAEPRRRLADQRPAERQ